MRDSDDRSAVAVASRAHARTPLGAGTANAAVAPAKAAMSDLVWNPFVDVVIRPAPPGSPNPVQVSAFARSRGFTKAEVGAGDVAEVLRTTSDVPEAERRAVLEAGLGAAGVASLTDVGLLVRADDLPPPFAQTDFTGQAAALEGAGYCMLRACVSTSMCATATRYFSDLLEREHLRYDEASDRFHIHNDAASRVLQAALLPAVRSAVGRPVNPSYTMASLYQGGALLRRHTDRVQCEYTLSLLIDYAPDPGAGPAPWPIRLHLAGEPALKDCTLALGDGFLFRGREIPHERPPLALDHRCWVLLLHYVNEDFEGDLD